jgi:2,4-dienoyl-CoA reductase-like NADH-dependent reductase (Old Yellow Enzyme family)/thioredoxin reductase
MATKYKNVFSPITIRGVEYKNRIFAPPVVPTLASENGCMTPELLAFHEAHVRGGAAVCTIGNASVNMAEARDELRGIDLSDDRVIPGLTVFHEMCESYGALANIEINHPGAYGNTAYNKTIFAVSPGIRSLEFDRAAHEGRRPVDVIVMNYDKIQELIEAYANAALRCKKAGFRMVMIHGAHGNLIPQFLSPFHNQRTDNYGGSLEKRARFAIEVLDAVRKKVGADMVIEFRLSADEIIEGGMRLEETLEFAKMIEDKIDILHVSSGMIRENSVVENIAQSWWMPRMLNVQYVEAFRKNITKARIATVGSFKTLANAEKVLSRGLVDIVAMMRPFLADPQFMRKYALGNEEDARPCIRCNACLKSVLSRSIHCSVNPVCGRETAFPNGYVEKAPVKKRVVVVGGGPAGMQAARTAVERGHDVTLYEKSGHLGGMLIPASAIEMKKDFSEYLEWAVRATEKCGAKVKLNTEVTPQLLAEEKPDALIIAVGAEPIIPRVAGIDRPNVYWAGDVDMGDVETGRNVMIIGGGHVGFECAMNLAQEDSGKKITIVEMLNEQQMGANDPFVYIFYLEKAAELGIQILCNTKFHEVTEDGIRCIDAKTLDFKDFTCDSVILALGVRPNKDVVSALRHAIPETEVSVVGDCQKPADLLAAVSGGFWAAFHV